MTPEFEEALELLYYSSNKLLFTGDARKIMDKKVKDFLEAHGITFGYFQHRARPSGS